jgi:thiol-disulfide isomerase/thioredoxin
VFWHDKWKIRNKNSSVRVMKFMKKIIPLLILIGFSTTVVAQNKQAETIKLGKLQELINAPTNHIKVINFWATWCAPCVKEMPLFEKFGQEREDVEVIFVSMDLDLDPNPEKVYRFVTRKKLQSKVVILDEKDPNSWIDKIDKNWSGALPATIVINGKTGKRKFVEKELHEGELEKLIDEVQ